MSREQDIAARLEAATPGPWHLSADRETITQTSHITRDVWTIPRTHEDMALIAHAPADLAYLLARIATLEADIATAGARGFARGVDQERASVRGWLRATLAAYRGDKVTPVSEVIADVIRDIEQSEHSPPADAPGRNKA